MVSVFDPEARPICRGKLSAKTEFGYKALITETEERLIAHYQVHGGNPADSDLLQPAFAAHVQVIGRTPAVVATDRGFGSKANEAFLAEQRVRKISLGSRKYQWRHSRLRGVRGPASGSDGACWPTTWVERSPGGRSSVEHDSGRPAPHPGQQGQRSKGASTRCSSWRTSE